MDELDRLESKSIYILREARACFPRLGMLWSIGKDSTVLLWLARKAFFGDVPFPLIHIDTAYKIPEMIAYRNKVVTDWNLELLVGMNKPALEAKDTFPDGKVGRIACCQALKTKPLTEVLRKEGPRWKFDPTTQSLLPDQSGREISGVIAGIRADEEGTRAKERVFSPRNAASRWDVSGQPPELWDQYKTEFAPGTHVRIHPLLDWTELHVWQYIARENIPVVPLYFDRGDGRRYRSLGCWPCTQPVASPARTPDDIVHELSKGALAKIPERSGRAQDADGGGTLETLRKEGYM